MRAVVTLGGTRERLDDVRLLTNVSTGRFGAAIARALIARGVDVICLASAEAARQLPASARTMIFDSTSDLEQRIVEATELGAVDLVFMAAAVSDYAPAPHAGKISSDLDEVHLILKRRPKILPGLRQRFPDATIVGFKLLSDVSPADLWRASHRQMAGGLVDLVVANDAILFGDAHHPAHLFWPGGHRAVSQARDDTAACVADAALEIAAARRSPEPRPPADPWHHLPDAIGEPTVRTNRLCPPSMATVQALLADAAARGTWRGGAAWVQFGEGGWSNAPRIPEGGVPILDEALPIGHASRVDGDLHLHLPQTPGALDRVASALAQRFEGVVTPDGADALLRRGFSRDPAHPAGTRLLGPLHRPHAGPDRVGQAASAVLVDPIERKILLGRRCQGAGIGEWSFPGGRCEPGEDHESAARRELTEETSVEAPPGSPLDVFDRYVSAVDGSVAWRVRGHVWPAFAAANPPRHTPELEAAWIPLADALRLNPLAPGILGVLERLARRFA